MFYKVRINKTYNLIGQIVIIRRSSIMLLQMKCEMHLQIEGIVAETKYITQITVKQGFMIFVLKENFHYISRRKKTQASPLP